MPRGVTGLSVIDFLPDVCLALHYSLSLRGSHRACRGPYAGRQRIEFFVEEALDQPFGTRSVVSRLQISQITPDRAEIKASVLLVAAGQSRTGEVPAQPKQPAALLGINT